MTNHTMLRCAMVCATVTWVPACRAPAERGAWDFERMRNQVRYDPWESSPLFSNGMAMRVPPEGTVPFDTLAADGVPASTRTEMPRPDGRERYLVYCSLCHGVGGYGGTVIAANSVPTAMFSLRRATAFVRSDSDVYAVITNGRGRMPAMAWQVSPSARRAIAAYVVELVHRPAADSLARADSATAEMQLGIDSVWNARQAMRRILSDSGGRRR